MSTSPARRPGFDALPKVLTPSEYFRRKWLRKIAWGTLVAGIAIGLAIWLGPQLFDAVKAWRGRKLVDFAQVQKNGGDRLEMKNLLLQAYGLAPKDEKVLRAMAEDYSDSPAEALRFYQQLALRAGATREDRLKPCRVALDHRIISMAEREFQVLLNDPKSKEDPDLVEICARYLTLRGEPDKALAWTEPSSSAAPKGAPNQGTATPQAQIVPASNANLNIMRAKLMLDKIQTDEPNQKQIAADVSALLWAAIDQGSETEKREAANLLARLFVTLEPVRQLMTQEQTSRLLSKLAQWSDDSQWDSRLVAADLLIFLNPPREGAILDDLTKASAGAKVEAPRLEFARWLNARDEHQRAQALAEANSASPLKQDWFLIRLDAMAAQKKWSEVETVLLDSQGVPIPEALGRLFLWRCAKELGKKAELVTALKVQVVETARSAPPDVQFFVAGYFEKLGEREVASGIYKGQTENEAYAGPAYLGMIRCISADPERTAELRSVLQDMLEKYPHVKEARNDLAYLNLLDGVKLNESIQAALAIINEAPQVLAYRTTLALAELVRGNNKQAEEIYRNVDLDWKKVNPGWVVVRAAVLAANGKESEAKQLAAGIEISSLRSGERKLLEKYVGK